MVLTKNAEKMGLFQIFKVVQLPFYPGPLRIEAADTFLESLTVVQRGGFPVAGSRCGIVSGKGRSKVQFDPEFLRFHRLLISAGQVDRVSPTAQCYIGHMRHSVKLSVILDMMPDAVIIFHGNKGYRILIGSDCQTGMKRLQFL